MDKESIKRILKQKGYEITSDTRNGNNTGDKLVLSNSAIVNCFDTGRCNVQGKNSEEIKRILECAIQNFNNKVFVVYGHDKAARHELEAILRRWKLEPLILEQLESDGNTIIEKLEKYIPEANFGIVLATPDDIGYPQGKEEEKRYRVRQNVVLEMGMLLAKLGRSKVAILLKDTENMEKPSDIHGLIYISFMKEIKECKVELSKELNKNGYDIQIKDL